MADTLAGLLKSGDSVMSMVRRYGQDSPSAEPLHDLIAQAHDLVDASHPRKGMWLSAANLRGLNPQAQMLLRAVHGDGVGHVPNFDGNGGLLITNNPATAAQAVAARDGGTHLQEILGTLTGAGQGKPPGATHAVQQVSPNGSVTREGAVTASEIPQAVAEFAHPGRQVQVLPIEAAMASRLQRKAVNG